MNDDIQKNITDLQGLISEDKLNDLVELLFLTPSDPNTIRNLTQDVVDGNYEFDREKHSFKGVHNAEVSDQARQAADIMQKLVPAMKESYRRSMQDTADFLQSDAWKELADLFGCSDDDQADIFLQAADIYAFKKNPDSPAALTEIKEFTDVLRQALPYIPAEVESYKKESGTDITLNSFILSGLLDKCAQTAAINRNPLQYAKKTGAITTIGPRLTILSDAEYQNSFITKIGNSGGIFYLDDATGKRKPVYDINTPFLQALFSAMELYYKCGGTDTVRIYFPSFLKDLGIDERALQKKDGTKQNSTDSRAAYMEKFIAQTAGIYGTIKGKEGYFQLFSVTWYDPEAQQLEYQSPYMQAILQALMQREAAAIEANKKPKLWKCDLMYATAVNERNQAAVEMAQRVLVGVQRRGTTPENEFKQNKKRKKSETDKPQPIEWYISFKSLINDCPQIKNQIAKQKQSGNKTNVLQRAVKAMYKILKKKSDLFSYYSNVTMTDVLPTYTTINTTGIKITHYGLNPDYKRPAIELPELAEKDRRSDDTQP